jgi:GT2 family glycosyltransferase
MVESNEVSHISESTQNTGQPPSQIEELRRENQVLKEQLLFKEQQLFFIEKEKEAQLNCIADLQNYLNLFLTHPAYKAYRFFKNLFQKKPQATEIEAPAPIPAVPNYEAFQRYAEPSAEDLDRFAADADSWTIQSQLDVVTVVHRQPQSTVEETVLSVLTQTYRHWTLYIADMSKDKSVWEYLNGLSKKDPRIKPELLPENAEISSSRDLMMAKGDAAFILLVDSGDHLAPHALHEVASAILRDPEIDLLYSDSDTLNEAGRRCDPFFKPDWSPETMLSINLANHLGAFRRTLLNQIGDSNPELGGARDWDLFLRISERTSRIRHLPKVLYHRAASEQIPDVRVVSKVLCDHLKRRGVQEPAVALNSNNSIRSITWKPRLEKRVSIIIPSRDHLEILQPCLESIFRLTEHSDYEVILVDTGSTAASTWEYYKSHSGDRRFKLVRCEGEFNFGAACNTGAREATGELLLFLNNDTLVLQNDWLKKLSQWFELSGAGIVGCKLIYPDGRLQHAGVVMGMGGFAWHLFHQQQGPVKSMFASDNWVRNVSAVTAACLMISREAFDKAQGFDEGYRINFGDADLCLRILQAGYRIIYTPDVQLIHHESVTRQRYVPRSDFDHAYERWFSLLAKGDPYFNPNLSYKGGWPEFRLGDDDLPGVINDSIWKRLPQKEILSLPEDLG